MRRERLMPDSSSSTTLSTPMLASPDGANTVCTAFAESPVSANLRTMASAIEPWFSVGRIAEVRMTSGISAVNACDAITMARSKPWTAKKRRTHRVGNQSSSQSSSSHVGSRIRSPLVRSTQSGDATRRRASSRTGEAQPGDPRDVRGPAAGVTPAG